MHRALYTEEFFDKLSGNDDFKNKVFLQDEAIKEDEEIDNDKELKRPEFNMTLMVVLAIATLLIGAIIYYNNYKESFRAYIKHKVSINLKKDPVNIDNQF